MLRLATLEDAETIATIHVCAWQIAYEGIVPTQYLSSLSIQKRTNMWRTVISEQHATVLLAIAPHGEVGFISFGPSRDKDGKEKGEIYAIYVLPEFWNQGIGRELLDEAERSIKDNHFIGLTLWVLEKNTLARRFYEARGFRLDTSRKEQSIGGSLLEELRYEKRMPDQTGRILLVPPLKLQAHHDWNTLCRGLPSSGANSANIPSKRGSFLSGSQ